MALTDDVKLDATQRVISTHLFLWTDISFTNKQTQEMIA